MGRRALRYLPLVAVVLLLALVAVVANTSGPRVGTAPRPTRSASVDDRTAQPSDTFFSATPPAPSGGGSDQGSSLPGWVLVVLVATVLAVGYGAIMLYLMLSVKNAVVFRRRRRGVPDEVVQAPAEGPSPEEIRAAVRAGLADLIEGEDPRAAVIACWLRLEELAERGGVPRSPSDAPGDLVARMLDGRLTGPAERALSDLTDVYRAARYAPHAVPESARHTARAALDRIAAELSVRDGVPS